MLGVRAGRGRGRGRVGVIRSASWMPTPTPNPTLTRRAGRDGPLGDGRQHARRLRGGDEISPKSPLHLPCISLASPLDLPISPCISAVIDGFLHSSLYLPTPPQVMDGFLHSSLYLPSSPRISPHLLGDGRLPQLLRPRPRQARARQRDGARRVRSDHAQQHGGKGGVGRSRAAAWR